MSSAPSSFGQVEHGGDRVGLEVARRGGANVLRARTAASACELAVEEVVPVERLGGGERGGAAFHGLEPAGPARAEQRARPLEVVRRRTRAAPAGRPRRRCASSAWRHPLGRELGRDPEEAQLRRRVVVGRDPGDDARSREARGRASSRGPGPSTAAARSSAGASGSSGGAARQPSDSSAWRHVASEGARANLAAGRLRRARGRPRRRPPASRRRPRAPGPAPGPGSTAPDDRHDRPLGDVARGVVAVHVGPGEAGELLPRDRCATGGSGGGRTSPRAASRRPPRTASRACAWLPG